MSKSDYFFLIFIITLIATRVLVYVWVWYVGKYLHQPPPDTVVFGFRLHHYMYGIIIMFLGYLFKSTTLYAVGMALFVDELTFVLMGGSTHEENYSLISLAGTGVFATLVLVFRKFLIFF